MEAVMQGQIASRRMHMELRTGDTLVLPGGVSIQLQFKKGQTARFAISSPPGSDVKKVAAITHQATPSPAF